MNFIILMGRLTADVQIKTTQSGISLANFTLAVDRVTNGEKKADFLRCVAFKNIAENIEKYFRKGDSILIQGSVQTRNYNDFEGNQRIITEVLVDRFYFISNKKSMSDTEPANSAAQAATQIFANPSQTALFKDNSIHSVPPEHQNIDVLCKNTPPEYNSDIEKLNGKGFTTLAQAIMKNSAKGLISDIPPHIIPNETRANHTPKYSMKNGFQIIDDNEGDLPF